MAKINSGIFCINQPNNDPVHSHKILSTMFAHYRNNLDFSIIQLVIMSGLAWKSRKRQRANLAG